MAPDATPRQQRDATPAVYPANVDDGSPGGTPRPTAVDRDTNGVQFIYGDTVRLFPRSGFEVSGVSLSTKRVWVRPE